jgi:hypothetical protein
VGGCSVRQRQSSHVMDEDVMRVSHVLPQNVFVSDVFPSVNQTLARRRDAGNAVEERVAEHQVRQCALIHIEPDILLAIRVPIVHKDDILGAHLDDCRCPSLCFRSVTVVHVQWFTVSPRSPSPDKFPAEIRVDELITAPRVPENSRQHARYRANFVCDAARKRLAWESLGIALRRIGSACRFGHSTLMCLICLIDPGRSLWVLPSCTSCGVAVAMYKMGKERRRCLGCHV